MFVKFARAKQSKETMICFKWRAREQTTHDKYVVYCVETRTKLYRGGLNKIAKIVGGSGRDSNKWREEDKIESISIINK